MTIFIIFFYKLFCSLKTEFPLYCMQEKAEKIGFKRFPTSTNFYSSRHTDLPSASLTLLASDNQRKLIFSLPGHKAFGYLYKQEHFQSCTHLTVVQVANCGYQKKEISTVYTFQSLTQFKQRNPELMSGTTQYLLLASIKYLIYIPSQYLLHFQWINMA